MKSNFNHKKPDDSNIFRYLKCFRNFNYNLPFYTKYIIELLSWSILTQFGLSCTITTSKMIKRDLHKY